MWSCLHPSMMTIMSLVKRSLLTTVISLSVYSVNHISIASHLLTSITSMSPNPSADSHWHDQPPMSTQDPYREDQQEEMPSKIFNQVVGRLLDGLTGGNGPASHQDLPEQTPSAGYIGDPAPEDHSHHSSHGGNTEAMSRQSHWGTFDEVVGRLERRLKDVEPAASQRQTTHGASTAQNSSINPDQDSKSINPSNDTVSGKDNRSSPTIPPSVSTPPCHVSPIPFCRSSQPPPISKFPSHHSLRSMSSRHL